ncbi:Cytochrome P450 monooxygenase patI [Paramyrothecium foliicola]|nr:Cytochrome P450 monooxygenase patI [Paramyrothecium foliicola]
MNTMASLPPVLLAVFAATAIILFHSVSKYLLLARRPKGFPPGPPTWLGLGNALQIPLERPYLKFQEWAQRYGSTVGLKIGEENIVILHDPEHVHELFSKRGAIYSGRRVGHIPREHVLKDHRDLHILDLQHGPELRRWRTAASSLLGPAGISKLSPIHDATSATLIHTLLDTTPSKSLDHFKHWALATPMLGVTGQRLEDLNQSYSDRYFHTQELWLQLLEPGKAPPVDLFPFLRWVPERFAEWKSIARLVRDNLTKDYYSYLEKAKSFRAAANVQQPSTFRGVLGKIVDDNERVETETNRFSDNDLAFLGGALVDAAVDTTWATMMTFLLFVAAHPDVQSKLYDEVHRLSENKVPRAELIDQLPYHRACVLEALRIRPPFPTGLPHIADRDDNFGEFFIPKGTSVMGNVWSIQHNPDDYEEPEKFRPERFLQHPMGLKPDIKYTEGRRATYAFGDGRRVCPGDQFALKGILLTASKLSWAYEIIALEPLDLSVMTGYNTGFVLSPKPFKVDFRLRDETKKAQIINDYEASVAELKDMTL